MPSTMPSTTAPTTWPAPSPASRPSSAGGIPAPAPSARTGSSRGPRSRGSEGRVGAGVAADRPGGADEQIIATVTALGHALGLSVTAEGVETAEQLETVRRLGVDTGQGWLFARALSADDIRALLTR